MAAFLVSASTGAMGSLLGKLGTMLTDEYNLLKDVRGDIEFLKRELEAMQAFLLMMADVEEPDPQAKLRADAVRELSYDIEDKIDKFMILVDGHEPTSKSDVFRELFNKSMKKIRNIKSRHKIAKDVKDIKTQVDEISKRYERYNIKEPFNSRNQKVDPRLCAVYKDASELIGIDGPRDELVERLNDEKGESAQQLKVVSIVGYGGLGKTTLARQVYNKLGANYECRAFVSISRNPDLKNILSSMLSQLRNEDYVNTGAGDPQLLVDRIRNFLEDKRYLIIIDDVWDVPTWRILECALVKNSRGSRVMSTTRKNDVAKSCCSSPGDLVHKMKPLSDADSKKLFLKRIFGCEESCPSNLREASEDILKRCGGLPLAINTISSLLAVGKSEDEWGRMRRSIAFEQGKSSDTDAMSYILSLSYYDLPLYLRSCLLYLTLFPEDYKIERWRLVLRWISEGLINGEDGEDLVELGDKYFHELVNRSLIQPVEINYDGKVRSCQVHDTILDFLSSKSTEDNFCTILSNPSKSNSRIRRLSLMGNDEQGSVKQLDLSHARSLGVFWHSQEYLPPLVESNALRVLDLQHCRGLGNHHVKDLGRLFQLRYLNISWTDIRELPRQIGDLKYLEMLDATRTKLVELPESVTRLKCLTRLFVPRETKYPDGIGNMKNLQELSDINTFLQSPNFLEELGGLTNLREITIWWDTDYIVRSDKASNKEEKPVSSLCKLDTCNLRFLCIVLFLREKDGFIGHPFFPALKCIRQVHFGDGQICWITKWLLSLANLESLTIAGAEIGQHDLEMVGSIPTLLCFRLCSFGPGPIIISGGFQQLHELTIQFRFTELMFEAGAMPNLKQLVLRIYLSKFKSAGGDGGFDFGIHHLSSLARVHLNIICNDVRAADVEGAECALKSMADAHPNRPTLVIKRCHADAAGRLIYERDSIPA